MVLARRTAVATAAMALLAVPFGLPKFYLLLATEILIMGLFALAFNLLLGYSGMVSFGHAAFYGVGAYTCGLLLKKAEAPFAVSFLAAPVVAAAVALLFGLLCIRLTRIYFSMLTLAFSQIVWAIAFKGTASRRRTNGLIGIPVPSALADPRALYLFTVAIVVLVGGLLWRLVNAPFGRTSWPSGRMPSARSSWAFTSGASSSPPSSSRAGCRTGGGAVRPVQPRRFRTTRTGPSPRRSCS